MKAHLVVCEKQERSEQVAFAKSQEKFEQIMGGLQSENAFRQTHSELEEKLEIEGRELLRQLIQEHYELKSSREARQKSGVLGSDGVKRNQVRESDRSLKTIFGEVEIKRLSYSAANGQKSLKPMDGELNLPKEVHSFGLQRRLAQEAAKNSFEEAIESVRTMTGVRIGKRQSEQMVVSAANDFDAFYGFGSKQAKAALKSIFGSNEVTPVAGVDFSQILVLTTDGKGVVVLEKDLRDATRKAATKKKKNQDKHQLSRGEKKNRKRMAQVASVYTVAPFVRTSEDIMREMRHLQPVIDPPKRRPRPQDKRVWASITKDAKVVIEEAFIEGIRRDPTRQMQWAILVDGSQEQLRIINKMAVQHGIQPTIIIDFIHVCEYVWKASTALFKEDTTQAESWVTDHLLAILCGKASQVAGEIRRSAKLCKLRGKKRKIVIKCVNYLLKNARYLRYHECLKRGLPIASGVIEGACRHLIKDRLDITGARWTIKKAEAILKLRSLRSSGDFEEYWSFHEKQEFQRNHSSNYANALIPCTCSVKTSLCLVKL